jgi:uroporphyrinogen III methyltransferase / synthase
MTSILLSPADASSELASELENSGVRVIVWPDVFITESEDHRRLDEAIESLFGYDWLILKNQFAAEFFLRQLQIRQPVAEFDSLRVLAIGELTAERLSASQIHVDVGLERFSQAAVFDAIESYSGGRDSLTRLNFLVPSANITRELFEHQLEDAGARVDNVTAYWTTPNKQNLTQLKALVAGGGVDAVVFTSPLAVEECGRLFDTDDCGQVLTTVTVISADATTHDAATQFRLMDSNIPKTFTAVAITELLNAL